MVQDRMNLIHYFNEYVRVLIGTEEAINLWETLGLPKNFTKEDVLETATDEDLWLGCVRAFETCCTLDYVGTTT